MPSVFKWIASGKPSTSSCPLHCLPRASRSSSLDLWPLSIIRVLISRHSIDPFFSADIKAKKKCWNDPSRRVNPSPDLLSCRLLSIFLRNFLVERASTRRLFRGENNEMRVERWLSMLVIHVSLLLPRLSRDHDDASCHHHDVNSHPLLLLLLESFCLNKT